MRVYGYRVCGCMGIDCGGVWVEVVYSTIVKVCAFIYSLFAISALATNKVIVVYTWCMPGVWVKSVYVPFICHLQPLLNIRLTLNV